MIYLTGFDSDIIQNYIKIRSESPFAVRIKGLLRAYGNYPTLFDLWYQINNQDKITAYIIRYGGEFIADIDNNISESEFKEIVDLCNIAGGYVLLCRETNFEPFDKEKGFIMRLSNIGKQDKFKDNEDILFEDTINLTEYYNILKANSSKSFNIPNFEDFYVDLNHRIRKFSALLVGIKKEDILISCCAVTALDDTSAVIAGVSTLPQYKGYGYGSIVVSKMCKRLFQNNITQIWLQRDINENFSFYHKLGFENYGYFEQVTLH